MDLNNKVVWMTGGARMGGVVAGVLSKKGCTIVLSYRTSKKPAEEVVRDLTNRGVRASSIRCDLTNPKAIKVAAQEIVRRYKRLDILVNLSSIYEETPAGPLAGSIDSWNKHLKTNAESAYMLSLAAALWMRRQKAGRIVHIADWTSASGRPRYKGYAPYYVSKAAIQSVTEAMALELAPMILVNAIAPGPILPPPGFSAKEINAVMKATPLARWGGAEEIAKAVLFLAETDFITGETIRVDGGRHLS
jgi:NAD(P)-dependent dehydrogenase (short-subunit alcohol dehydrogenase family)